MTKRHSKYSWINFYHDCKYLQCMHICEERLTCISSLCMPPSPWPQRRRLSLLPLLVVEHGEDYYIRTTKERGIAENWEQKCWRRSQPCRRNPGNRRQCGRSFPLFARNLGNHAATANAADTSISMARNWVFFDKVLCWDDFMSANTSFGDFGKIMYNGFLCLMKNFL